MKQKGGKREVVDIEKLFKINQDKVSFWTMAGLTEVIRGSRLITMSNALDSNKDKEIASEWEASIAAVQIFENVAKSDHK